MPSSPCILIVEDNLDSCEMIRFMLGHSDKNYRIFVAQTAENALALIDSQPFDLYILDYWLPKMTGIELCGHIRKRDGKTPIMFFSAMARPADREEGIAAGADEYLVKPNDLIKISETVKRLLQKTNSDSTGEVL